MDTFTIQLLLGLLGAVFLALVGIGVAVWVRLHPEKLAQLGAHLHLSPKATADRQDSIDVNLLDHLKEFEKRISEELAALYDHVTSTAEEIKHAPAEELAKLRAAVTAYANTPVKVTLAATTAPIEAVPEAWVMQAPGTLASSFPDADALRAIVNMMGAGLTQAVRLDGVEIHPGADPAMSYVTQPDGPVRIA